ncbi:hypothetical protein [Hymenobacter daeguensis]
MFYLTRVVLHRADGSEDYTQLHTEMQALGFSRSIVNDADGISYQLPPAEYFLASDTLTTAQVWRLAVAAVNAALADDAASVQQANEEPCVLVTASSDIEGSGLAKVALRKKA